MKLFQKLIVAPAALGFLIPSAAFAEEIKLADISNYSSSKEVKSISEFDPAEELAVTNSRVDGLESRFNNFEAGSFSETTTMDGGVDILLSAADGGTTEAFQFQYVWDIDLDTSFTGEDNLEIGIAAGQAQTEAGGVLDFGEPTEEKLKVIDANYTFPVGDNLTMKAGNSLKISKSFDNACAYDGLTDELGHCGDHKAHQVGGGVTLGGQYDFGNGFTMGAGISGANTALLTKEDQSYYGLNAAYSGDNFGLSVAYAMVEAEALSSNTRADSTYWGIIGSYSFDDSALSSISVGYGTGETEGSSTDKSSWFAGLMFDEVGPGSVGIAAGTDGLHASNVTEDMLYEAYYAYDINDGMSQTLGVYYQENNGGTDETGIVAVTSFSF
jgi:hypothetical protein